MYLTKFKPGGGKLQGHGLQELRGFWPMAHSGQKIIWVFPPQFAIGYLP